MLISINSSEIYQFLLILCPFYQFQLNNEIYQCFQITLRIQIYIITFGNNFKENSQHPTKSSNSIIHSNFPSKH